MLRLEGSVNGLRVARNCETADSVTATAAVLLDACAINELRLLRILESLHLAALDGRTWGWSATEFSLSLHGQQDIGGGDSRPGKAFPSSSRASRAALGQRGTSPDYHNHGEIQPCPSS